MKKKMSEVIEGMAYPVGEMGMRWRCRIDGVWYDCDQFGRPVK